MFLGGIFAAEINATNRLTKSSIKQMKKCYTEDTDNLGSCSHLVTVKIAASDALRWYELLADLKNQNMSPF
jgi:hypothetical protein